MDDRSKTVVVVPCYNEAQRLRPDAFLEALSSFPWLMLLFIDDGSIDRTPEILDHIFKQAGGRAIVHTLSSNVGKAEAVRQGILRAFEEGAPIVGYWDADLSSPLGEIVGMRDCLIERQAWIVYGSRVRLLGRDIRRNPLRHYLGRLFATMASLTLQLPVYDTQCGAKLFANRAEVKKLFATPFESRWIFDVEILMRVKLIDKNQPHLSMRTRVVEHPLEHWYSAPDTRLKGIDFGKSALELARIGWTLTFGRNSLPS